LWQSRLSGEINAQTLLGGVVFFGGWKIPASLIPDEIVKLGQPQGFHILWDIGHGEAMPIVEVVQGSV